MTPLPWRCGQPVSWDGPSGPTRGELLAWWQPEGVYRLSVREKPPSGALTGALVSLTADPAGTLKEIYRCA